MSRLELALPTIPAGRPNLLLTGFMASGKTTVGSLASELLQMPFFDLDSELEARLGESVPQLLRTRGEGWFRAREAEMMVEASRLSGSVIATGGGAVLSPPAFAALASSAVSLVLWAEPDELAERAARGGSRPLLDHLGEDGMRRLLAERAPAYARAGDPVETTGRTPAEVARCVVESYRRRAAAGPAAIPLRGVDWQTELVVGPGAVAGMGSVLERMSPHARRAFVVVDSGAAPTAAEVVAESLIRAGLEVSTREVAGGEPAKTLESLAALWHWLLAAAAERDDLLVAVGGGALLDAAGFAAATYARGIAHLNVPTTVLAMADAALGGKTAINLGAVKNPVGVFRHPIAVVADPALLGPMGRPGARDGLAEVIKAVVIGSRLVLNRMGRGDSYCLGDAGMAWLIEQAFRIKAGYVVADPGERGVRSSLNLGHTYAHGLEAATGYAISHGEAVGLGLLASAALGATLGTTPVEVGDSIRAALSQAGLPLFVPSALDQQAVSDAMLRDKKRRSGRVVFIVPGSSEGVVVVDDLDLESALEPLWALQASTGEVRLAAPGRSRDG